MPTGPPTTRSASINFVDVTVDRATDAVQVRAIIANPSGLLIDSQLVRVILESGTPEEKLVIPQAALIADQEGVYVFVVEDGKAVGEARSSGRRERHRISSSRKACPPAISSSSKDYRACAPERRSARPRCRRSKGAEPDALGHLRRPAAARHRHRHGD